MSGRFLAEDFRKLMDSLDQLIEAPEDQADKPEGKDVESPAEQPAKPEQDDANEHGNVDNLLISKRTDELDKSSITDVMSLIDYLDQFPELKDYRDYDAKFDDAYYSNLSLGDIEKVAGLKQEDLNKINDQTEQYEGLIWIHDGKVDILGGD